MQFEVRNDDYLAVEGDGLLVPTVTDGTMREGIAARVREVVGDEIEAQVVKHAPIAVGAALVTDAPGLDVRKLIHAPLVDQAGLRVGVENIRRATRAALLAVARYDLDRLVIPGMGYGENGVPTDEAARAIIDEVIAFKSPPPSVVVLIDADTEMSQAFEQQLGSGR